MKSKKERRPGPAMVEEGATERLKKRARDLGLIVNADAGEKHGTIASQTKTTRRLDRTVKRDADAQMTGAEKAAERWDGEGGAVPPAKREVKK